MQEELKRNFPDLYEPEVVSAILNHAAYNELGEGELLMDIGSYIKTIPLVLNGLLKVTREDDEGNEILLYFIRPGETCALSLSCCMGPAKSTVRVIAEEPTELLALPVRLMDTWTDSFKSWKTFVMLTYQRRMEELLHTIDGIAFQRLDERLIELLKKHAVDGNGVVQRTHQQLAAELNSSREVISRLLKRLEKEGMVQLGRGRVILT